jgi:nondiscriminating glutamyl-tRNA synthetase
LSIASLDGRIQTEMTKKIRVRIAPSPTGFVHVGTAYTALFNWAFARKTKGKFIIRIEDTDVKRHVKGAQEALFSDLKWLGIDWDEGPDKGGDYGPYCQSQRLKIYHKHAEELLKHNLAFKDKGAIRFKNPFKSVSWQDAIRGKITFPGEEIGDFVIVKSDGYPTYNFAVVIDDILMAISHVIRGEEHISNTPRQIAVYQALKENLPQFAHLPLLRNPDRSKISKRKNPVALSWYKNQGYLPQALINFLCLLGWSHPDGKEIFDKSEFAANFDLARVRKTGPVFDLDKLDWLNGEYVRRTPDPELAKYINELFNKKYSQAMILKILPLIKTRIKRLSEFPELTGFFFQGPKVDKKLLGKTYKKHLKVAVKAIEDDEPLDQICQKNGFVTGEFFMDLRVAVTGNKVTPPINESIKLLGKTETIKRLKKLF